MTTFAVPEEHQHKVLDLRHRARVDHAGHLHRPGSRPVVGVLRRLPALRIAADRHGGPTSSGIATRTPYIEDNAVVKGARRFLPITDDYVGGKLATQGRGSADVHPVVPGPDRVSAASTCSSPWTPFRPSSASPANPSSSSRPTPSRCSVCARCSSWSRICWIDWSISTGLSIILAFIGVKLILHWLHVDINPACRRSPTPASLAVISLILAVVIVASVIRTRRDPSARAHPGSLRGHADRTDHAPHR